MTSLKDRLKAEIAASGPISVADYMLRCLHDPQDGYYATRPALGAEGDFLTAPLVSQMFGELIGLWAVETWTRMGRPARFVLAEMGPGDGTLMSDMLRAARLAPGFLAAAELWLIETSPPLRTAQAQRLEGSLLAPHWADRLIDIPQAPLILVANELLDCLPALQILRAEQGWAERRVGLDADGELGFGLVPSPWPDDLDPQAPPGVIWELSTAQESLGADVGALVRSRGGAALFIDYGRSQREPGDTLQALRRHRKVDPLACPGEADLTMWADFPGFLAGARASGAEATACVPQGEFLRRLGLDQRAEALMRARPDRADAINAQRDRLAEPDQMGELFKACVVHAPGLVPPGFEEEATR